MAVSYSKLWKLLELKICNVLECNIEDIMELTKE